MNFPFIFDLPCSAFHCFVCITLLLLSYTYIAASLRLIFREVIPSDNGEQYQEDSKHEEGAGFFVQVSAQKVPRLYRQEN